MGCRARSTRSGEDQIRKGGGLCTGAGSLVVESLSWQTRSTGKGISQVTNRWESVRKDTSFATTSTRQSMKTQRKRGSSVSPLRPGGSQVSNNSASGTSEAAIIRNSPSWSKRRTHLLYVATCNRGERNTMPGMRRLAQFLSFALLVPSIAASAQVRPLPEQTSPVSAAPRVTFNILSDTKGTQLNSYLGNLAPKLRQSFLSHLSAADAKQLAHQQVDLLITIGSQGDVSALRLTPGTQDSPASRAAWAAAKDTKWAPLPSSLGGSSPQMRMHFVAA